MVENEASGHAPIVIGGVKRSDEVAQATAGATGESVLVVASINKIRPPADVLVLTETKLVTGSAPGWGRKTTSWAVRLSGRDILSVHVRRSHVVVQTPAGEVRLGDVFVDVDRDRVVEEIRALQQRSVELGEVSVEDGPEGAASDGLAEAMASFLSSEEWPAAATNQLRSIAVCLRYAQQYSAGGDVAAEEQNLWDARRAAERTGLAARKVRKRVDVEIAALEAAGRVRKGSRVLGEVRSNELVGGARLLVRDDRVLLFANSQMQCRALDRDVVAAVEVDGQVFETSRPTLTRMALGAPLPGSALLVGLATQKKERRDERTAVFGVVHPQWQMVVRVDPRRASGLRPLAAQVNAIAAAAGRSPAPGPRPAASSARVQAPQSGVAGAAAGEVSMQTVRAQLEEIETMRVGGLIDDAEAQVLRKRALG